MAAVAAQVDGSTATPASDLPSGVRLARSVHRAELAEPVAAVDRGARRTVPRSWTRPRRARRFGARELPAGDVRRPPASSSASRAARAPASRRSRGCCATGWQAEGYAVLLTFEPGDTPVGKELRRIVLSPETGELSDRTEALLYAADKAEHVDTRRAAGARRGARS